MEVLDSDDASTQMHLFNHLVSDGPSTSASETNLLDTQALINQQILQPLNAIGVD